MNPSAEPALPPRGEFSEPGYLRLHADVAAAIEAGVVGSAWQHFVLHGRREGRAWVRQADPLIGVNREIAPGDDMFLGNADHYFDVGASALRCIENAVTTAGRVPASIRTILDLPCGFGRVTRFLRKAFPSARLTACDLQADGVTFCARTFGAEPVVSANAVGDIPLRGPFDLIWCGSLLTHLREQRCLEFLRFFRGLLAVDGILVVTMHGRATATELASGRSRADLDQSRVAQLLADCGARGFAYVDYAGQSDYGFSLARRDYLTGHLLSAAELRLVDYQEKGWDSRQDVLCLRRG